MRLPEGRLVRSRVVADLRTLLVDALDRRLTGYAVLEPQNALLLDDDGTGVVTFSDGAPVLAYHTGTERGGPAALADIAASGPYRLELVAVAPSALDRVHAFDSLRVPPGMAAERLAGDPSLADRTRSVASETDHLRRPADVTEASETTSGGVVSADAGDSETPEEGTADAPSDESAAGEDPAQRGAVEAFLDDAEKIEAIREAAREEADERASEWGFDSL